MRDCTRADSAKTDRESIVIIPEGTFEHVPRVGRFDYLNYDVVRRYARLLN